MTRATTNGIEIEYEAFGDAAKPTMLLVMGFSRQLIAWDDDFCLALVARGFRVVRFDNRDVGLSTRMKGLPGPDISAILGGDLSTVAYSLEDMAYDAAGLLDTVGVASAHVVGASMGGMIAQILAIKHAPRVKSLCSIMSTTGDRSVGQPAPSALGALFTPAPSQRAAFIDHAVVIWRTFSSPTQPFDEALCREQSARAFDRSYYPAGVARQLGAILGAKDRTAGLHGVKAPSLVIHGAEDPLITLSGGEATARAIPGAELLVVPGMGHELPRRAWPVVVDAIATNAARAEQSASRAASL